MNKEDSVVELEFNGVKYVVPSYVVKPLELSSEAGKVSDKIREHVINIKHLPNASVTIETKWLELGLVAASLSGIQSDINKMSFALQRVFEKLLADNDYRVR